MTRRPHGRHGLWRDWTPDGDLESGEIVTSPRARPGSSCGARTGESCTRPPRGRKAAQGRRAGRARETTDMNRPAAPSPGYSATRTRPPPALGSRDLELVPARSCSIRLYRQQAGCAECASGLGRVHWCRGNHQDLSGVNDVRILDPVETRDDGVEVPVAAESFCDAPECVAVFDGVFLGHVSTPLVEVMPDSRDVRGPERADAVTGGSGPGAGPSGHFRAVGAGVGRSTDSRGPIPPPLSACHLGGAANRCGNSRDSGVACPTHHLFRVTLRIRRRTTYHAEACLHPQEGNRGWTCLRGPRARVPACACGSWRTALRPS